MSLHRIETLTRNFYEWELLGRGWRRYPHLVPIEPAFRPFPGHVFAIEEIVDDGRKPTFLSSLWERLTHSQEDHEKSSQHLLDVESQEASYPPQPWEELEVLVPPGTKIDPAAAESFLRSITALGAPLAFELVGRGHTVSVRFACTSDNLARVRGQLRGFFPDAHVRDPVEPLLSLWGESQGTESRALEFGLAREFMLPLRELRPAPDSLTAFVSALAQVESGDLAVFQVFFAKAKAPWAFHAERALTAPDGEPFFLDAPELTRLAEGKFASPLYAALIRIVAKCQKPESADEIVASIASGLSHFGSPDRNEFVPLAGDNAALLGKDILLRSTHRSGMLLSLSELVSLVHPPSEHLRHSALIRSVEKVDRLPEEVLGTAGSVLGEAGHLGKLVPVRVSSEARMSHTYVIGASGTGKSTLLLNLILQDIQNGEGVGILDPHGDLVDEVLARIPEERVQDVVLFDPADPEYVIGWNILGAHSEVEKDLLASDLIAVFRRLSTSWGDQMSVVLGNAVLAFLESREGGTLTELRRFLLDDAFRTGFLGTVADDHVVSFWKEEWPLLVGKKPQAPILTRLDTFLRSKLVREAVTESEQPLNFREVIDDRRIFLGKLSQGAIGEENASLLGSLLVSKFHQVSLSRQDTALEKRKPFLLYLDEFQQMVTPSMASLFSGARKYRLGLTVAHQDLYQLHATAPEVERSALANAFTRVVFRVSDEDARKLEKGMGEFSAEDLVNQKRGEAVCRVGRKEDAFRMKTLALRGMSPEEAETRRLEVRRQSFEKYGRPRRTQGTKRYAPPTQPLVNYSTEKSPTISEEENSPEAKRGLPVAGLPGRGGATHKYLQGLIREWAQANGFRAEIEKEIDGGKRVDVALSREGVTIACEIAGTTTVPLEIANLTKSLAAGFTHVLAVSLDRSFLSQLQKAADSQISESERERIELFSPEELLAFLSTQAPERRQERVAGYAVTVSHKRDSATEAERRRAIAGVILKSIKRVRETQ